VQVVTLLGPLQAPFPARDLLRALAKLTGDNTLSYGVIKVAVPCNVDGDRDIDICDVVGIASVYGAKKAVQAHDTAFERVQA